MRLLFCIALPIAIASSIIACKVDVTASAADASDGGGADEGGNNEGGSAAAYGTTPCDPFAMNSVTVSGVLGAGKDKDGTLYVMAAATDVVEPSIYIAHAGGMLAQKATPGAGMGPGDYSVTFVDGATTENLLLQIRNGAPTEMALGPVTSKGFIGMAGAVSEVLTLVDVKSVEGTQASALAPAVVYVGDSSDGRHIVLLGHSGSPTRLFFGKADAMVEYTWTSEPRTLSATTSTLDFVANGVSYKFTYGYQMGGYPVEAGTPLMMLPGQLTASDDSGTSFDSRDPAPQTITGFSFVCL